MATTKAQIPLDDILRRIPVLFRYWLRKWYVIFIAALLGAILSIGYVWMLPPVYEAKGSFAIDEKSTGLGGALGLAAEFGLNLGGNGRDVFSGENIVYIMNSQRMVRHVLLQTDTVNGKVLTIADWYLQFIKYKGLTNDAYQPVFSAGVPFQLNNYQDSVLADLYLDIVKNHLSVAKPDKKFNVYEIGFRSPNPRLSKIFASKLMDAAANYYTELRTSRSKQNLDNLEARVAAMKGKTATAIEGQASQKDANLNPVFARAAALGTQKQMDIVAYGRAYEELFKNLEIARYQYLSEIPFIQVIDSPDYPIKNKKPGRFKSGIIAATLFAMCAMAILSFLCFYKPQTRV